MISRPITMKPWQRSRATFLQKRSIAGSGSKPQPRRSFWPFSRRVCEVMTSRCSRSGSFHSCPEPSATHWRNAPGRRHRGYNSRLMVTGIKETHMIKFYYHPSPNPAKVALFLEESGLPYELGPIDTRKGEQFAPSFVAINPNAKTPAIVDGDVTVFDSNAILLYLAEKTGKFLPENTPVARGQLLSWLMFVATGIGPYSGQAVHFKNHAPEKLPYAIN